MKVAIKKVRCRFYDYEEERRLELARKLVREVKLMKHLAHENVRVYAGYCVVGNHEGFSRSAAASDQILLPGFIRVSRVFVECELHCSSRF